LINTFKHLSYVLKASKDEIINIIDNVDKFYYVDSKKQVLLLANGTIKIKERTLHPSQYRLKIIQSNILSSILEKIPLPSYAFGAVKGRNNILNGKKHQGNKFFFLTDIKKFFPSIDNKMVFKTFRYYGFSPTVSRILTQLTTYKGMLPQGAPTSSYLSNLVFYETIGNKIEKLCKEKNITFSSFIDDLTLSSKRDFKGFEQEIIQLINQAGFRISHNKTYFKSVPSNVTGIKVGNNSINPSPKTVNKLNQKNLETQTIKGVINYINNIKKINRITKKRLSL